MKKFYCNQWCNSTKQNYGQPLPQTILIGEKAFSVGEIPTANG